MSNNSPIRSGNSSTFCPSLNNNKKKDPPLTPDIENSINALESSTVPASADDYKKIGNMCYSSNIFSTAIKYYTKALEADPENCVHYSNRSAAYLNSVMVAGCSLAIKDADQAIRLKPDWYKGYLRKGDALYKQDKLDAAIEAYDKVLVIYPDCSCAISSKSECMKRKLLKGAENTSEHVPLSSRSHRQESYRAEPVKRTATEYTEHPTPEETQSLIETWGRDTNMDNDATATKKYNRSLNEADRELGKNIKAKMMGNFRNKLDSDPTLKEKVMSSIESEKLRGVGYDYLRAENNQRNVLSKGTNEVGHAISAESYLSYKYKSKVW